MNNQDILLRQHSAIYTPITNRSRHEHTTTVSIYTLGKLTIYAGILGREEELTIKRDGQHMREFQQ